MPGMLAGWKPRVPREISTTATFGGQIRLPTDFIHSTGYVFYRVVREPTGAQKLNFVFRFGFTMAIRRLHCLSGGVLVKVTFIWDEKFLKMEPGGFSESLVTVKINGVWDVTPCSLVDKHQYYGGLCCLHFQSKRVTRSSSKQREFLKRLYLSHILHETKFN